MNKKYLRLLPKSVVCQTANNLLLLFMMFYRDLLFSYGNVVTPIKKHNQQAHHRGKVAEVRKKEQFLLGKKHAKTKTFTEFYMSNNKCNTFSLFYWIQLPVFFLVPTCFLLYSLQKISCQPTEIETEIKLT